jgi:tRNA nucleotidyltransferase (CCA-adding enzyme)
MPWSRNGSSPSSTGALGEPEPGRFFEMLRASGALEVLFPELARLYGVPQPARYHPEIDTGVHILLVLDVVASLTPDRRVRFAALVHDLGKGTTPREQWPSHRGHEERSVALIHGLCDRYRVPNDYRNLAVMVARYHATATAPWNCGPARCSRPYRASTPCDGPNTSVFDIDIEQCE